MAGGKISKRHMVGPAGLRFKFLDRTEISIRRQPGGHGQGFGKGSVHLFGGGFEDSVKSDAVSGHGGRVWFGLRAPIITCLAKRQTDDFQQYSGRKVNKKDGYYSRP